VTRGPHETQSKGRIEIFLIKVLKINVNKLIALIFHLKASFFLMFAGRVFETPALVVENLQYMFSIKLNLDRLSACDPKVSHNLPVEPRCFPIPELNYCLYI